MMNALNLKSNFTEYELFIKNYGFFCFFYEHLLYWMHLNGCFWCNYVGIYSIILFWLGSEYVFWIYPKGENKFLLNQIRFWRNTTIKLIGLCIWKVTLRKVAGLIIYSTWTPLMEFSWKFFDFLEQLCMNFQLSCPFRNTSFFSYFLAPIEPESSTQSCSRGRVFLKSS